MRESLLSILVDPMTRESLRLHVSERSGDEVVQGTLQDGGSVFPINGGIPRFAVADDEGQRQTGSSFGYKWGTRRDTYGSDAMQDEIHPWMLSRYGFNSSSEMRAWFADRRWTLDAGCGGGQPVSAWIEDGWDARGAQWVGVDLSAAIDAARDRLLDYGGMHFVQADIMHLPFREGSFDGIFSEGVLHHTPSTELAIKALVPFLTAGGELMFYVYRRKAPLREFADDFVRAQLAEMAPHEAWEAVKPLTELAQALAELGAEVEVPDVPLLGIKAGRYDVQRLIYWNVAKLFWNSNMSFEENNHINFDWYAPAYAHRHTEDEVRRWCADENLDISHLDVDDAGFTVRAVKPG